MIVSAQMVFVNVNLCSSDGVTSCTLMVVIVLVNDAKLACDAALCCARALYQCVFLCAI
jgi:hypothetical protein